MQGPESSSWPQNYASEARGYWNPLIFSLCATNQKVDVSIPDGDMEFFIDNSFWSHYGPGVDSASNRNEYQEYFLAVNMAGAKGWQTYHHSVTFSRNLVTLISWKALGNSRPVKGLLYLFSIFSLCFQVDMSEDLSRKILLMLFIFNAPCKTYSTYPDSLQKSVDFLLQNSIISYIYPLVPSCTKTYCGPGSSVGIANDYGLDGPGIETHWGARFSAPVQTGHGTHPASCTGSFPGVKCGWGVLLTSHPLLMQRSWKSRAIPLPTLWATPGL
jgi:hypothetical protein